VERFAQILPFYFKNGLKFNELNRTKNILRNQYPEVRNDFLTDGKSRSYFQKFVIMDTDKLRVLGVLGAKTSRVIKKTLSN